MENIYFPVNLIDAIKTIYGNGIIKRSGPYTRGVFSSVIAMTPKRLKIQ